MMSGMIKTMLRFILMLALFGWAEVSYAGCKYVSSGMTASTYTVTVPALSVEQDEPAGKILWDSGYLHAPSSTSISCDSVSTIWRGFDDPTLVAVHILDNNGIYQTNNPGIAIRVWWLSYHNNNPGKQTPDDARAFRSPRYAEGDKTCADCHYENISGIFDVQLIATGQPITDAPLQLSRFSGARTYDTVDQIRINFTEPDVVVNSASCILNSKNIAVNLGSHIDGYRLIHAGDTSTPVSFNIDLTCDPETSINVLFSGATVAGDNTALALSNLSDPTSAQGVGVQVLYNDRAITFGELIPAGKYTAGGSVILPFKAQVLRLNETLKAGEINATATFDMIYR